MKSKKPCESGDFFVLLQCKNLREKIASIKEKNCEI